MRPLAVMLVLLWVPLLAFGAGDEELLAPLVPAKKAPVAKPAHKKPRLPAAPPAETELAIAVSPLVEGAHLTLDGRDMGLFPQPIFRVNPGLHTLQIRRLGYADVEHNIRAPKGKRTEVSYRLEPQAGVLYLSGSPDGARVQIDGSPSGVLPLAGALVSPGSHLIRLEAEGYEPSERWVTFRAGHDERLQMELIVQTPVSAPTPAWVSTAPPPPTVAKVTEPPFFSRWYVWAGIGALAAGAAAAAIATTVHGPPPPSSQVCSGPCDTVLNGRVGTF